VITNDLKNFHAVSYKNHGSTDNRARCLSECVGVTVWGHEIRSTAEMNIYKNATYLTLSKISRFLIGVK